MDRLTVRPERFMVEAAIIDWIQIIRRRKLPDNFANLMQQRLKKQGIPVRSAHLRWSLHPEFGMPTEPFVVWRRPIVNFEGAREIVPVYSVQLPNTVRVIGWGEPLALVTLRLHVPGPNAMVIGTSGAPTLGRASTFKTITAGTHTVELAGPDLTGMIVMGAGVEVQNISGVSPDVVANNPGWQKVEIVGFPVEPDQWAGVGNHDRKQGLLDPGLVDPEEAAIQRLLRGTPLLGWDPEITPGVNAPPWILPDKSGLIHEMRQQILPLLREMAELPPHKQQAFLKRVDMPPPENTSGQSVDTEPSQAEYAPLGILGSAVTSDPLLSLALGYGTAIEQEDLPAITLGDRKLFAGKDDFDYMVTAHWERGLRGQGEAFDGAALALRPGMALAGAAPGNLEALVSAPLRPQSRDGHWRRSVRLKWDRLPRTGLYRIASYAAVRVPVTPSGDPHILNEERDSGGILPISTNSSPGDSLEPKHLSTVDREVEIPTGPGFTQLDYAIATQTIFGLWGQWTTTAASLVEPGLDPLQILSADFHCINENAICDAELVVDLGWDWSVRTPRQFSLRARLYPAVFRGTEPPSLTVPAHFPRRLGGVDAEVLITFSGDEPSVIDNGSGIALDDTIQAMSPDGSQFVAAGVAQSNDVRRYRLTLKRFSLDFSGTPHICAALWARVREQVAPANFGLWSPTPLVASASDPRPLEILTDDVQLASLPDAKGECHARIAWPAVASAAGYIVYETTETRLRHELGLGDTPLTDTLEARLATLRSEYNHHPVRRAFTRRGNALHQGTSLDITLPRGSKDIHCFMVLTQNLAQVESDWPSGTDAGDRLIPIAAPRIIQPQAPTLEVRRIRTDSGGTPSYHAWLRISMRPGPRVKQLDIYRCRVTDAVRQVDTMGPPLLRLTDSTADWQLEQESDTVSSDFILQASGNDQPEGSWKKVWYRAVVWSEDDPARGLLKGRSEASSPQWVVIPPASFPPLSELTAEWAGGPLQDILLRWRSTAPIAATALGSHRLSIVVKTAGHDMGAEALLNLDTPLENLPTSLSSDTTGLWREGLPDINHAQEYRALIKRLSLDEGVNIAVRLRDPIGRISERLLRVEAGPVDPEPDITDLQVISNKKGLKAVAWTSHVPVVASLAGAYQLMVIAEIKKSSGLVRRSPVVLGASGISVSPGAVERPNKPRLIRPLPGRIDPGNIFFPGRNRIIKRKRVIDIPDIPIMKKKMGRKWLSKLPEKGLLVWREKGATQQYGVASRENVIRFIVRMTAPDGRYVEASVKVK